MKVLRVPSTSKLAQMMEVEDVVFVHFGYSTKCLDPMMAPASMSGFGFWLPLHIFGLKSGPPEMQKYPCMSYISYISHIFFYFVS